MASRGKTATACECGSWATTGKSKSVKRRSRECVKKRNRRETWIYHCFYAIASDVLETGNDMRVMLKVSNGLRG